jgi:Fe-S oxidoreductase
VGSPRRALPVLYKTIILVNALETIKEKCIECPACKNECPFLSKYGTPKAIAERFNPEKRKYQALPFECSLCGLCQAVCPLDLNPVKMFLEMRRKVVERGDGNLSSYSPLLRYEKRGTSKRYTYYALPERCDAVFFPGCALSGTRPEAVIKVCESLKVKIPNLGIVLDCCTKPSHDLGRMDYFKAMFNEMKDYLLGQGIKTVFVACPNCYQVFEEYGSPLKARTVYEILAEAPSISGKECQRFVTVHDPCVTRFERPVQNAVRALIRRQGVSIEEMEHWGEKTLCCGEGGAVGFIAPDLAENWKVRRKSEARGKRILTYCAGCADVLNQVVPTSHVLDLYFRPEAALKGKAKASRAPFTYWNRLRLKKYFQKNIPAIIRRERTIQER